MHSGIHIIDNPQDETLTEPSIEPGAGGTYMATLCGRCHRYKSDAAHGPRARLFRFMAPFCACPEQKTTLTLDAAEIAKLCAAAVTG